LAAHPAAPYRASDLCPCMTMVTTATASPSCMLGDCGDRSTIAALAVSRPRCHVHVGVQRLTTAVVSCDALHLRLQPQGEVIQFSARSPRLPLSYFVPNLTFGQTATQRHSTIILGQTAMHQIQRTTDMKIPEPDSFQMRTCIWMHHISKDLIPVGVKNLELHKEARHNLNGFIDMFYYRKPSGQQN
jgi:hypothetical protein